MSETLVASRVAPALQPVAADKSGAVRQQCFAAVAQWLQLNPLWEGIPEDLERAAQHRAFTRHLLPILVLGLTDESLELAQQTQQWVQQVTCSVRLRASTASCCWSTHQLMVSSVHQGRVQAQHSAGRGVVLVKEHAGLFQ